MIRWCCCDLCHVCGDEDGEKPKKEYTPSQLYIPSGVYLFCWAWVMYAFVSPSPPLSL